MGTMTSNNTLGIAGTIVFPKIFSAEECAAIISLADARGMAPGYTHNGKDYVVDETKRRVQTAYMERDDENDWIYGRMDVFFGDAAERLGMQVSEVCESMKVMRYDPGDHFGSWHMDVGNDYAATRKISMSIELSDQATFVGGALEIFPENSSSLRVPRGGGVAFPSFRFHRVTPVTSGVRYSLVNWISGPAY